MRRAAMLTIGMAAALLVASCEDRECVRSHTELMPMPVVVGKTTVIQLLPHEVCDEYAEEAP